MYTYYTICMPDLIRISSALYLNYSRPSCCLLEHAMGFFCRSNRSGKGLCMRQLWWRICKTIPSLKSSIFLHPLALDFWRHFKNSNITCSISSSFGKWLSGTYNGYCACSEKNSMPRQFPRTPNNTTIKPQNTNKHKLKRLLRQISPKTCTVSKNTNKNTTTCV